MSVGLWLLTIWLSRWCSGSYLAYSSHPEGFHFHVATLAYRLPTKANLILRGILCLEAHYCVFGCEEDKSAQHLFLSWSAFSSLWSLVRYWIDFSSTLYKITLFILFLFSFIYIFYFILLKKYMYRKIKNSLKKRKKMKDFCKSFFASKCSEGESGITRISRTVSSK
jgi:hypothetical protein